MLSPYFCYSLFSDYSSHELQLSRDYDVINTKTQDDVYRAPEVNWDLFEVVLSGRIRAVTVFRLTDIGSVFTDFRFQNHRFG